MVLIERSIRLMYTMYLIGCLTLTQQWNYCKACIPISLSKLRGLRESPSNGKGIVAHAS